MSKIKICGITNIDDARVAVEAGADMVGLIFYPPSPRYVSPQQAQRIVEILPASCRAVGVFVNEDVETIKRIACEAGVQVVQLHGSEPPEVCQQLAWPVFKTFRFTAAVRPEMMRNYRVKAFLIEGFHADYYGGSGSLADWHQTAALHKYGRIILAGGLTANNVAEAIRIVNPYAVDVCSGVEREAGKKDWVRLRTFIAAANAASLSSSD
jgi:phosphoribosylanthranilate isomerase